MNERRNRVANKIVGAETLPEGLNLIESSFDRILIAIQEWDKGVDQYLASKGISEDDKVAISKSRDLMERGVIAYLDEINDFLSEVFEPEE